MITAELRNSLTLASATETFAMPSLEAFDDLLPLPMWRDIMRRDVRYQCPVARLLAAQNHLDGNLLASHWQAFLLSSREKMRGDSAGFQSLKSSEGSYYTISSIFSLAEETQLEQAGSLLSWTLEEQGLRRWLAVSASSIALGHDLASECSALYGSKPFAKQRTAEREFNWQYSYGSSDRLLRFLTEVQEKTMAIPLSVVGCESLVSPSEIGFQGSIGSGWTGLLPLVLAQMNLVDAMAVAPKHVVSAADQLSHAWVSWLSVQVLNDLRLSQMAESLPFRDVACVTSALLGRSIQVVFGQNPVGGF